MLYATFIALFLKARSPERAPTSMPGAVSSVMKCAELAPHAPRFAPRPLKGVFYFMRECRPRPERMNARLPALKRVFSPLEYKKTPARDRSQAGG